MEKEFLSIVMVHKEFRSMILGAELFIYADDENLNFDNLYSHGILCCYLFEEEWSHHPLSP